VIADWYGELGEIQRLRGDSDHPFPLFACSRTENEVCLCYEDRVHQAMFEKEKFTSESIDRNMPGPICSFVKNLFR